MKMYESPKCELLEVQTTENLLLESNGSLDVSDGGSSLYLQTMFIRSITPRSNSDANMIDLFH